MRPCQDGNKKNLNAKYLKLQHAHNLQLSLLGVVDVCKEVRKDAANCVLFSQKVQSVEERAEESREKMEGEIQTCSADILAARTQLQVTRSQFSPHVQPEHS